MGHLTAGSKFPCLKTQGGKNMNDPTTGTKNNPHGYYTEMDK